MKAKANKAILEQERKKKERLANSSRLTIIRIDLTHKEEEEDFTFKDAICEKYNLNTNMKSSDVFERFSQEFYRGLDKDEFVIFTEKKKGITISKKNSNQVKHDTSQTLTGKEIENLNSAT